MTNMLNFLHMGGYAAYVWSAYGLAAVIMLGNLVLARRYGRRLRQQIKQANHREKTHAP